MVDQLVEALLRLKREHTTILLVEQNFRVAEAVGDDVAVMDEGRTIHTGDDGGARAPITRCSIGCWG